jgi:GTP pyrophosphokinase
VLEESETESEEFVDQVKLNLFTDEIFVFTPRGDLKRLPKGATLLDFAFEIHSEVGSKCTGGKVNHKNVTLRHVLQNGDMVEVTTQKNQKPKHDWLSFVITSKAKSRIRQSLNEEKTKAAEIGKEILKRRLRNWKITFSDENVKKLLRHYQLKYAQDLYFLISEEKIVMTDIKDFLTKKPEGIALEDAKDQTAETRKVVPRHEDFLLLEDRVENVDYKLARCCNPIVGDRIFGFVTVTEGIKVHRMDCPNAKQLLSRYPYRIIQARWTQKVDKAIFDAGLRITGLDDAGIMNRISEVITNELRISIQSVHFSSAGGAFESEVRIRVTDRDHLDFLIRKLSKIKGVLKVSRISEQGMR